MNIPAISVRNLGKAYRLGVIGRKTLQDELRYLWLRARRKDPRQHMGILGRNDGKSSAIDSDNNFWALRNVSLDVNSGEVLGIIGRNGAGKSTLLKLLTRITDPTEGEAVLNGRVASLLEVGTGFHGELTGRENIFLNGSILGMKKEEIRNRFDSIVEFAEISEFMDTPVKRYSSGMYVRLAFAVAAHLETEIMLVDEVLAVGDVAFQKKCLGKMRDVAGSGRTVLFVSHSMPAIRNLCSRVILLDEGRLLVDSDPETVIGRYLDRNLIEGAVASEKEITNRVQKTAKAGMPYMKLTEVRLEDSQGATKSHFEASEPVVVSVSFECYQSVRDLRVVVAVADEDGVPIYGSQSTDDVGNAEKFYTVEPGRYKTKCILPADIFGNRKYYLNVDLLYPKREQHKLTKILEFDVSFRGYNPNIQYGGNDWGWYIWQKLKWCSEKVG